MNKKTNDCTYSTALLKLFLRRLWRIYNFICFQFKLNNNWIIENKVVPLPLKKSFRSLPRATKELFWRKSWMPKAECLTGYILQNIRCPITSNIIKIISPPVKQTRHIKRNTIHHLTWHRRWALLFPYDFAGTINIKSRLVWSMISSHLKILT